MVLGVGLLNSAFGAGAILGSALTVLLLGKRLVAPIVTGRRPDRGRRTAAVFEGPMSGCREGNRMYLRVP